MIVRSTFQFTDRKIIQAKRDLIVSALGKREKTNLIRKTPALYWNSEHDIRMACTISKRYKRSPSCRYWYAYHRQWDDFLGAASRAFFVLGCVDLDIAFAVPLKPLRPPLNDLNTTVTDRSHYWHIHISESHDKQYSLLLPKRSETRPIGQYAI